MSITYDKEMKKFADERVGMGCFAVGVRGGKKPEQSGSLFKNMPLERASVLWEIVSDIALSKEPIADRLEFWQKVLTEKCITV